MILEIQTPDALVFSGEVSAVKIPGTEGQFEVLNNHAAIISALADQGVVYITTIDQKNLQFPTKGGIVEVINNKIAILTQ